jgi:membrane protein required for beta-lactamase induction
MKLIALILGFGLEHFATQLLHLRELRLFDGYFDAALKLAKDKSQILVFVIVIATLGVLALPVVFIHFWLRDADIRWDLVYIAFALFVVFLCLGPRDLDDEVAEYTKALDAGDGEGAKRVLFELAEAKRRGLTETEAIEEAIFVQAPNRIFGVVFWFIALGPVGAWFFRISDLLRRRTAFEAQRETALRTAVLPAVELIHALLLWIPVRLAALGYALSGSFDDALNRWRALGAAAGEPLHRHNDMLVAGVGRAAMSGALDEPANSSQAARNALRLVTRTLFIWMIVIALMTIFGWAV